MNFQRATNELLGAVTLTDLAIEIGVSLQAIRQARSAEGSASRRSPPDGWQKAVAKLASQRAAKLLRLAATLKSS